MPLAIWNYVLSLKQKNYFSEDGLVWTRNYFHLVVCSHSREGNTSNWCAQQS